MKRKKAMAHGSLRLKQDRFRCARGGYARWRSLICTECGTTLCAYQKDGPGVLKRLYLDRIVGELGANTELVSCKMCGAHLGVQTTYRRERRPAIRLFVGAISSRLVRAEKAARVRQLD